jgi:hypothetical protein
MSPSGNPFLFFAVAVSLVATASAAHHPGLVNAAGLGDVGA